MFFNACILCYVFFPGVALLPGSGHATIAITLDTYSHVTPSMDDATAKTMEDALG